MVRRSISLGQLARALLRPLQSLDRLRQAPSGSASVAPPPAPAPEPLPVAACSARRRPKIRSSTLIALLGPAFQGRPAGARARPRRGGAPRVRQGRERPARIAVRRPDRAAHPRAFRSAGRSHQRLRGEGARRRRRLHREEVRAGVDRRAAGDVGDADAAAGQPGGRGSGPDRPGRSRHPDPAQPARAVVHRSCSRAGCTTSSQEGLERGSKYLPMIQDVFRAEGLPLDLAYIPLVESAFKPNALSRAKAKGVWQFMRGTGRRERPAAGLVHRRALGSREGDGRRGEVPEHARQDVRRRLAPGAGVVQRRPRPRAAGAASGASTDDFWTLAAKPRICCPARRATTCR